MRREVSTVFLRIQIRGLRRQRLTVRLLHLLASNRTRSTAMPRQQTASSAVSPSKIRNPKCSLSCRWFLKIKIIRKTRQSHLSKYWTKTLREGIKRAKNLVRWLFTRVSQKVRSISAQSTERQSDPEVHWIWFQAQRASCPCSRKAKASKKKHNRSCILLQIVYAMALERGNATLRARGCSKRTRPRKLMSSSRWRWGSVQTLFGRVPLRSN